MTGGLWAILAVAMMGIILFSGENERVQMTDLVMLHSLSLKLKFQLQSFFSSKNSEKSIQSVNFDNLANIGYFN